VRDTTVERRERLADLVTRRGFLRVSDASELLGVSEVTVRGDLTALEESLALVRVHGGAMPVDSIRASEPTLEQSEAFAAESKRAIGIAAASLVRSGNSVLLDVGSTALAVARALVARTDLANVTVITNGLSIALALEPATPQLTVVLTGGTLRPLQHSLVNPGASEFLATVHADLAFIGCNGVDVRDGVTNVNFPEAEVKRRMLLSSSRRVLIADATKIGQTHLGVIGAVRDFDHLVTSADADRTATDALHAEGIGVIRATSDAQ
jgi:DeoR family transcriptional regulator of aga operon